MLCLYVRTLPTKHVIHYFLPFNQHHLGLSGSKFHVIMSPSLLDRTQTWLIYRTDRDWNVAEIPSADTNPGIHFKLTGKLFPWAKIWMRTKLKKNLPFGMKDKNLLWIPCLLSGTNWRGRRRKRGESNMAYCKFVQLGRLLCCISWAEGKRKRTAFRDGIEVFYHVLYSIFSQVVHLISSSVFLG